MSDFRKGSNFTALNIEIAMNEGMTGYCPDCLEFVDGGGRECPNCGGESVDRELEYHLDQALFHQSLTKADHLLDLLKGA